MSNLDLHLAISRVAPHLKTWSGKGERPYRMADLIVVTKPDIVVELGVFRGGTLIPQALALKYNGKGTIYGIDPYDMSVILEGLAPEEEDAGWWTAQNLNDAYETVQFWIKKLELERHVEILRETTTDCTAVFSGIDILHIDASHNEKCSCEDVERYGKLVKEGGYIWFDDSHFQSTQKALKELETFCTLKQDYGDYRLYQVKE